MKDIILAGKCNIKFIAQIFVYEKIALKKSLYTCAGLPFGLMEHFIHDITRSVIDKYIDNKNRNVLDKNIDNLFISN